MLDRQQGILHTRIVFDLNWDKRDTKERALYSRGYCWPTMHNIRVNLIQPSRLEHSYVLLLSTVLEERVYVMFEWIKVLREFKTLIQHFGWVNVRPYVILFGCVWYSH